MSNFRPPYLPEFKGEAFYDCPRITYPLLGVAGAPGDVVEAVLQQRFGLPTKPNQRFGFFSLTGQTFVATLAGRLHWAFLKYHPSE